MTCEVLGRNLDFSNNRNDISINLEGEVVESIHLEEFFDLD